MEILTACAAAYRIKMLAWSVLRDRAYFVLVPPSAEALSSFMRVAHTRYARFLHATGFRGDVTPRRFASCALDTAAALDAIKLVESRPVAGRLADHPADYVFGSAAIRAGGKGAGRRLLSDVPAITGKVRGWKRWHAKPLDPDREGYLAMRMRTGKPAGTAAFVRRIEGKLGMDLSRSRGRPKGS